MKNSYLRRRRRPTGLDPLPGDSKPVYIGRPGPAPCWLLEKHGFGTTGPENYPRAEFIGPLPPWSLARVWRAPRLANLWAFVVQSTGPRYSRGLSYANGQLMAVDPVTYRYQAVTWGSEKDPTERILASSLAGQYSYQITGPGDLEEEDSEEDKEPGIKKGAQARARYALDLDAARRAEQYARDEDLPAVEEGPYQEAEPWYDSTDDDIDGEDYIFAPVVDQAVQADGQRHGIHPDLRWDGEGAGCPNVGDSLADLRLEYRCAKGERKLAIGIKGKLAKESLLASIAKRDADSTRYMARGKAARRARRNALLDTLQAIDAACKAATKAIRLGGREYAKADIGLARAGLAWAMYILPKITTKLPSGQVCPVIKSGDGLMLSYGQRQDINAARSALLSRWSHITGLTRKEALVFHRAMLPGSMKHKGAWCPSPAARTNLGVTAPMGKGQAVTKEKLEHCTVFQAISTRPAGKGRDSAPRVSIEGADEEDIFSTIMAETRRLYRRKMFFSR